MRKTIEFGRYNAAEIIKLYEDNSILCKVIEESIDEDGIATEISHEDGISFDSGCWPFELTEEEIESLKPQMYAEIIEE